MAKQFDLIIKNGTVIDGTGRKRFAADVAIKDDKMAGIGSFEAGQGATVIDARGKICPGFIDVHTHTDGWYLKKPNFFSKTGQGFTTEVIMADGISYAPVNAHTVHEWIYYLRGLNGLQFEDYTGWESISDYMALLDGRTAQNTIPHIPYANVRSACGFGRQGPDDVQMNHIIAELKKGWMPGQWGYQPGLIISLSVGRRPMSWLKLARNGGAAGALRDHIGIGKGLCLAARGD